MEKPTRPTKRLSIEILDTEGKKTGRVSLPEVIFGVKTNPALIAQAVRVYLANQKKARPKTKTRAEVAGSGRKIYRQKGTGRARHGDQYAPIFVGGGVAHGPAGTVRKLVLPPKAKKAALFSALTEKFKEGKILAVAGLEKSVPKTKVMEKNLFSILSREKLVKTLLVLSQRAETVSRATRNIPWLSTTQFNILNYYEVLDADTLIFTKEAIQELRHNSRRRT
jgi:large subunit ribosomal protein L4